MRLQRLQTSTFWEFISSIDNMAYTYLTDDGETTETPTNNKTFAVIADGEVTYEKIQNVSGTDKVLGRQTSGAGVVEEIPCTAAGRALIAGASAAAQRTTLELGTLATQSGTFSGSSSGTNTGDQVISDATISITDITTNNFSTSAHGFVPKGTNVGNYLKDDGTWAEVSGGSGLTSPQVLARSLGA